MDKKIESTNILPDWPVTAPAPDPRRFIASMPRGQPSPETPSSIPGSSGTSAGSITSWPQQMLVKLCGRIR